MILLWGLPGDTPLDEVREALGRRHARYWLLDQRQVLTHRVELELGTEVRGRVWSGAGGCRLDEVEGLYMRVYDAQQLPAVGKAGSETLARVRELEAALWAWADDTSARVLNRPTAMASNGSKPYQISLIARHGFRVPETLVTTDPEAARAFWERHGTVIYKSVSGVRSRVARLGPEHLERLADVAWCPTQFQAYVPGRDHRVHVVGGEVFAAEIISDAVDYRYAQRQGSSVEIRGCALPEEVAERCRVTAAALGLPLAGLDLRRTPEGEWFCFEVNPSPCFTYYENLTGQPIAAAVAAFLDGGHQ